MMRFGTSSLAIAFAWLGVVASCSAQALGPAGQGGSARMELIQPPRELRLALRRAVEAQRTGDSAELAGNLGLLMEGLARTDYLTPAGPLEVEEEKSDAPPENPPQPDPNAVPPETAQAPEAAPRPLVSMQGRTYALVESLTREQREAFETLHGNKAKAALNEAVERNDIQRLEDVAHRWRYLDAGREATLLLARRRMDEQRFAEAARLLQRLRKTRHARLNFEPELSTLLVSSLWMLGRSDQAASWVRSYSNGSPQALDAMPEVWRKVFGSAEPTTELTELLGAPPANRWGRNTDSWPMFLGNADRQGATSASGLPIASVWRRDFVDDKSLAQRLDSQVAARLEEGTPELPAAYPVVIGDYLLARTPERLLGLNVASGKEIWSYPFDYRDQAQSQPVQQGKIVIQLGGGPARAVTPQTSETSKVWGNNLYGRLSADGDLAFVIDGDFELPSPQTQHMMMMGNRVQFRRGGPARPPTSNRLTAIDLQREGAVAWVVGGETGEMNPDFKNAFFLGAPLPAHGRLYVLYEREGLVNLGVLDARTGATEWSMKLAPLASGASANLARRMLGVAPSLVDGVLVCPTTVDGLMAIDISERRFLWGWAPKASPSGSPRNAAMARMIPRSSMPESNWVDTPIQIRNGLILHATDSDTLYCLDLLTGEPHWSRRRADAWFVACLTDEVALIVGKHRYTALRLTDGKPAWTDAPYRAIPAGGIPTGRGFCDATAYYLPTSESPDTGKPELLRIDLSSGKAERAPLEHRLGNLVPAGGSILSVGPNGFELLATPTKTEAAPSAAAAADTELETLSELPLETLVARLGADDFRIREAASKELIQHGADAIPALAKAAVGEKSEPALRAVSILLQLKENGLKNEELENALRAVAEAGNGAAIALPTPASISRAAVAKIRSLGAHVHYDGNRILLINWQKDVKNLEVLRKIDNLEHFHIIQCPKGDEILKHVSNLNLISLSTQRSNITDKGLTELKGLKQLNQLDLSFSEISDKSIDKLSEFKGLQTLNLNNTQITREGNARLVKVMPNTRIMNNFANQPAPKKEDPGPQPKNGADAGPGVKKPDPEQKPPNVEGAKKDAAQNAANKVEAKAATKTEVKPPNAAGKAKPVEKIEPKKID